MFIGHFAVGLGAKRYAPQVSLGMLFLACQLADLIWPTLVLLGIETVTIEPGITALTPLNFTHYPYSHSLLALSLWAGSLALLYLFLRRAGTRAAMVIALLVVSHWVLDVLSHRPDMPLVLGASPHIGLGLWNHPWLFVPLELALFATGAWMYTRQTRALDRIGSIGFWALAIFLLLIYAANLLGPPPPSTTVVAWSTQAMWLIVAWGFWVDRHRTSASDARAKEASPGLGTVDEPGGMSTR
ncbi:MAG: hypothetical protein OQK99_14760 [Gammaproteobacteria bacterium]|jgi:membrane-bound metal-dependent hydrolase YbcI (DUF457 family)|nr:hypothetical protein [Gammaproteobacteria bacterium]